MGMLPVRLPVSRSSMLSNKTKDADKAIVQCVRTLSIDSNYLAMFVINGKVSALCCQL